MTLKQVWRLHPFGIMITTKDYDKKEDLIALCGLDYEPLTTLPPGDIEEEDKE